MALEILALVLLTVPISGCLREDNRSEVNDPFEIVTDFLFDLDNGDYYGACSYLISKNGLFLNETDRFEVHELVKDLKMRYGAYGEKKPDIEYDITENRMNDLGRDISTHTYEILLNVTFNDRMNYSETIDVIEFGNNDKIGILVNGSNALLESVNIFPVCPLDEDLLFTARPVKEVYSNGTYDIFVNLSIKNVCGYPTVIKGSRLGDGLGWHVTAENGTIYYTCLPLDDHDVKYFIVGPNDEHSFITDVQISYTTNILKNEHIFILKEIGNYTIEFSYFFYSKPIDHFLNIHSAPVKIRIIEG